MVDVTPLARWINERHAIYMRKAYLTETPAGPMSNLMRAAWGPAGLPGKGDHWTLDYLTDDEVLRQYRFCNVYRELDRVTVWVREHIREAYADHPHLWFMLATARTINWPPTLQELIDSPQGWPANSYFTPARMGAVLDRYHGEGHKTYTGAYMIRAESDPKKPWYSWSKQRYIAEVVLGSLWNQRNGLGVFFSQPGQTLQRCWEVLQAYTGWGPFMAYQVVVDLRWTRYLQGAPDINTWAALGPGSRRGLNRLIGAPVKTALSQEQGLDLMIMIRRELQKPDLLAPWVTLPDLSDVQNCLCEYDKHERARLGEGRPRAMYVPGRGS